MITMARSRGALLLAALALGDALAPTARGRARARPLAAVADDGLGARPLAAVGDDGLDVYETTASAPARLDACLANAFPERSRGEWAAAVAAECVRVNDVVVKRKSAKVAPGDDVRVVEGAWAAEPLGCEPEDLPIDVLVDDEQFLVANKAVGMVTHPAPGSRNGTLANAVAALCAGDVEGAAASRPGIARRPSGESWLCRRRRRRRGVVARLPRRRRRRRTRDSNSKSLPQVHRLDKETSGAIVVAKTAAAGRSLRGQFADRTVSKVYLAVVARPPPPPEEGEDELVIDAPIGRHPTRRERMAVAFDGKRAVSRVRVVGPRGKPPSRRVRRASRASRGRQHPQSNAAKISLDGLRLAESLGRGAQVLATDGKTCAVQVAIDTGRTHQIRVHLAHVGSPIVGDAAYVRRADISLTRRRADISPDETPRGYFSRRDAATPRPRRISF